MSAKGLSVSSLLDRFLRLHPTAAIPAPIVLSVSSLLDRFLRLYDMKARQDAERTFSILAVGSFPQTKWAKMRYKSSSY